MSCQRAARPLKDLACPPALRDCFKDIESGSSQRNLVITFCLHAISRDGSDAASQIEFRPTRQSHLSRARRCQDQKTQGDRTHAAVALKGLPEFRQALILESRKMPDGWALLAQNMTQLTMPCCRVGIIAQFAHPYTVELGHVHEA